MLNALQSYQFEDHAVRVVLVEGDPWWVANDLCAVLDLRNPRQVLERLDDDERGVHLTDTLGGAQPMNIVSESGMFGLVLGSRKPEARRFRRWVTGEVLPSIRKTGRYEMFDPPPPTAELLEDHSVNRLTAAVGVVREARQIFGPVQARSVWEQLGLPMPIVEAVGDVEADPLVRDIAVVLADKAEATVEDVAGMLGWNPATLSLTHRRRIGAALRLLGWRSEFARRDGHPVKLFRPLPRRQAEG